MAFRNYILFVCLLNHILPCASDFSCLSMSYNKYKGYYCLSWTSWILFILGGLTIGFGYLCERNPDLMATIHLHTYSDLMKYGGSVIAFWGFFGIISVCGGCILYLYSIVSVLFSVIFLTLFIISLVYTVQINVRIRFLYDSVGSRN